MNKLLLWMTIAATLFAGLQGCKKKDAPRPSARAKFKEKLAAAKYRKPLMIFNNSGKPIKTLVIFYDDNGIIIHDLKPSAGIEELLLADSPSVEMQYFITYADKRQVVVPKMKWNFVPGTVAAVSIGPDGRITYK